MLEFKNKQQLMSYTSIMSKRLDEGEIALLEDERKSYVWKDYNWVEIKLDTNSNVKLTMYELNEQLIKQLPNHNKQQIKEDMEIIDEFYEANKSDFYMLLCKEHSYFTVLRRGNASDRLGPTSIALLIEIGHSIRSVENLNDMEVEIWSVDDEGEVWCSHLFNYEKGVVEFGG